MVIMTPVTINGTDITNYIAFRGVKWSYRYVNGRNTGVTLAGVTQLDVLATKSDLNITCIPLSYSDIQTLLGAISEPSVEVTYDDPLLGTVTKTMHPSGQTTAFLNETSQDENAAMMWDGISFKLEEL